MTDAITCTQGLDELPSELPSAERVKVIVAPRYVTVQDRGNGLGAANMRVAMFDRLGRL